jgi:hypothetical protein
VLFHNSHHSRDQEVCDHESSLTSTIKDLIPIPCVALALFIPRYRRWRLRREPQVAQQDLNTAKQSQQMMDARLEQMAMTMNRSPFMVILLSPSLFDCSSF